MAQFDVYDTPVLTLRQQFPYMAVLQSDRLQKASERIVAPMTSLAVDLMSCHSSVSCSSLVSRVTGR